MDNQEVKDKLLEIEGAIEELADEYCLMDIAPVMSMVEELVYGSKEDDSKEDDSKESC